MNLELKLGYWRICYAEVYGSWAKLIRGILTVPFFKIGHTHNVSSLPCLIYHEAAMPVFKKSSIIKQSYQKPTLHLWAQFKPWILSCSNRKLGASSPCGLSRQEFAFKLFTCFSVEHCVFQKIPLSIRGTYWGKSCATLQGRFTSLMWNKHLFIKLSFKKA